MVQLIGKYRIPAAHQRAQHADIGHIAGAEQQSGWHAYKIGKLFFQRVMITVMAGDEVGSAAAHTGIARRLLHRRNQFRAIGQTKIIVAAEGKILVLICSNLLRLRRIQQSSLPHQTLCLALFQLFF